MKRLLVTAFAILAVASTIPAQARHLHHRHHAAAVRAAAACDYTDIGRSSCGAAAATAVPIRAASAYARADEAVDEGSIIGARPDGCPHAYCGCGLRKYLGLSDVRLNLARNWARFFPHEAAPAAGLAAVRAGHVMYIEASAGNGAWLVRDYNSGGGLSRLHVRDVRGYVFVNPRS